jgi:hypothetical protein
MKDTGRSFLDQLAPWTIASFGSLNYNNHRRVVVVSLMVVHCTINNKFPHGRIPLVVVCLL